MLSNANYSAWEETIAQIQTSNKSPYQEGAYLHKLKIQSLKSDLEKAKRARATISFLFFQMKQNPDANHETNKILTQKILVNANYRLRISDEAMILNNGVLISLFGTQKKDRKFITDLMQKRIKRSLKHLNLNMPELIHIAEATFPDDGNTLEEILTYLQSAETETAENKKAQPEGSLANWLNIRTTTSDISYATSDYSEPSHAIKTVIKKLPLPPIWFFNLTRLLESPENSPRIFEAEFLKQCPFHEKVIHCAKGIIACNKDLKGEVSDIESLDCKQILLLIGADEFKNILTWACMQNIIFKSTEYELTPIREFAIMTASVALELSNQLEYHHRSELLLFCTLQSLNLVVLKIGFPELFESFFNSKNTPFSVLAKNCHETTGTPYSALALPYLTKWNLSESILESLTTARYESLPKMNPQLVALTYLATCLTNHLSGLSLQGILHLNQLAWDEILLRNRNIKLDTFDGYNQFENILKKYSYLFIN